LLHARRRGRQACARHASIASQDSHRSKLFDPSRVDRVSRDGNVETAGGSATALDQISVLVDKPGFAIPTGDATLA
jgi:hypothetical protein